jgi:dephospho-CoA kinase
MPIKVGITGGIGSGKSTVAEVLRTMGYPVYNSDRRAKELMETDPAVREQLVAVFGETAFAGGTLNRPFLAQHVFTDEERRKQINAIVHPAVRTDFERWAEKQRSAIVFQEAAILFETGGYKLLDKTILVTAPVEDRIRRVMQRDGASEAQVRNRIGSQLPDEQKIPLADGVIDNGDGKLVVPQIQEMLMQLG